MIQLGGPPDKASRIRLLSVMGLSKRICAGFEKFHVTDTRNLHGVLKRQKQSDWAAHVALDAISLRSPSLEFRA